MILIAQGISGVNVLQPKTAINMRIVKQGEYMLTAIKENVLHGDNVA